MKGSEQYINYQELLKSFGTEFRVADCYLKVGESTHVQGWILHLSIIASQLEELLKTLLPLLIGEQVPFKLPADKQTAVAILNGRLGYVQLGKVVSIYPGSDDVAKALAKQLIDITGRFKGPRILTDRHLGAAVYTRYGAFSPIIRVGSNGSVEKLIRDASGNLMIDRYNIPFVPPPGIPWPFSELAPPVVPLPDTVLQNRYKPTATLKTDAKGGVKKAIWLKKWYLVKWCIIKEGKRYMIADDTGRDVRERLRWQFELHKDLQGVVPIPEVFELFKENGDLYLTMEYIKGIALDNVVMTAYRGTVWHQLSLHERLQLLDYALQVLDNIGRIHQRGYVHRDITTVNFLVTKRRKLALIDLELAYSLTGQKPHPPFSGGTAWFMSPEQKASQTPTIQQDIYALGATLIVIFTGLLPSKFATVNIDLLQEQLYFFVPDKGLVAVIARCFNNEPEMRPPFSELREAVVQFKEKQQKTKSTGTPAIIPKVDVARLNVTVNKALQALSTPVMISQNNLWQSKTLQDTEYSYYQMESVSFYSSFHVGVAGVMYVLARANKIGLSIAPCLAGYNSSLEFIREKSISKAAGMQAGLYTGTAGIAMVLSEGIASGLLTQKELYLQELRSCLLNENTDGFGVAKGLSGRGLSLLHAADLLGDDFVKPLLLKILSQLLHAQQKDGSWLILTDNKKVTQKITGFGHGAAGIICFLIGYAARYKDQRALEAAAKALYWLQQQARNLKGSLTWRSDAGSKQTEPGMANGHAGICLAYIKAFELLQEPVYRKIAEKALRHYPLHISGRNLTLAGGVSGIGEVYLEASKVFGNSEWQERADWITQLLLHHYRQQADGSCYWMVDHTPFSTADLMTGNSGVIHFLMRSAEPHKLTHPLLPM